MDEIGGIYWDIRPKFDEILGLNIRLIFAQISSHTQTSIYLSI